MSESSEDLQKQLLKVPTSFEQQVEILKGRKLIIEDETFALDVLSKINYYRFSAYLLPFKEHTSECYKKGTCFNRVFRIYEFDRKLRNLILSAIEPVEVLLKTKIAYYHAHKYGSEGYIKPENFDRADRHARFVEEFNETVKKNSKTLFVKHHMENYGSHFPIWVAVELFSLGMLSKFYMNMKPEDRKYLAKNIFATGPDHLASWLVCLTDLRNRCAHYMRLYFHRLVTFPRLPKGPYTTTGQRVFDIIFVIKYLYLEHEKWKSSFVPAIDGLLAEYVEDIRLRDIGFPENWLQLLEKDPNQQVQV